MQRSSPQDNTPGSIMVGTQRKLAWVPVFLILILTGKCFPTPPAQFSLTGEGARTNLAKPKAAVQARVTDAYGKLPLMFEANHGQTDAKVRFLSRAHGYTLFLTSTEAVLALRNVTAEIEENSTGSKQTKQATHSLIGMKLLGANPEPRIVGLAELPSKSSYFIGNDPETWHSNIPTYAKVKYQDVYPGVDLVYYGNQGQLEYDFEVAPGADPSLIQLGFEGVDELTLDGKGNLTARTSAGVVVLRAPVIYQQSNDMRQAATGGFVLQDKYQVGFEVGTYDASRPLVIDPVVSYSTYLGGSGNDVGLAITVDADGSAYITGSTSSANFPTENSFQQEKAGDPTFGVDAFVAKLNPAGSALVYSTYLGGSGNDVGLAITVDADGSAYITGSAGSADFPTVNPIQASKGGTTTAQDAFVTKLNPTGDGLLYSTYLGGGELDIGSAIAVDSSGNAYVTGVTNSSDFPVVNPLQPTKGDSGGFGDSFVAKLNAAGSAFLYSTYLGGNRSDAANAIAVDAGGNAYVTGLTGSMDFPTVNPFQSELAGGGFTDAFVAKVNSTGSALVYSTYLGGTGFGTGGDDQEQGQGIAVDVFGNAYVTGTTPSTDFPTRNALQPSFGGGNGDTFVTKLNPTGDELIYSTYLGGNGLDPAGGIAVDSSGNVYVTGATQSTDFPTLSPFQDDLAGGIDSFVAKLNATGSELLYSTYLGGSNLENSFGFSDGAIAVDSEGSAYVTGNTGSWNFPTTPSAIQPTFSFGGRDAFVAKILDEEAVLELTLSSTGLTFGDQPISTTSAAQIVNLTNSGNSPVMIDSLVVSGDFVQTNTCGTTLHAGISCNISTSFTPRQTGSRSGNITITSNASGQPHVILLEGNGIANPELLVRSLSVANFVNGNNAALNSRVYLWNPSASAGNVTVRVFTVPLTGGLTQELTATPLSLGTLGAKSALNVKVAEDILTPLGILTPYTENGGNLTLEFTIEAADVQGAAQVFSSSLAFGTYPLQQIPSTSSGSPTVLIANFVNGNNATFNSRVYLWNPSEGSGTVTVRVFTLPPRGGAAQELTGAPLSLGTLEARSALNVKVAEDILTPLGIPLPYTENDGDLTLEFTIEAAAVRGATQVFSSSLAFGTNPLQQIPSTSSGSPTVLVANFMNGNDDAFNSRVYLWNPSQSAGEVAVRVFTLPLAGGLALELTGSPLNLGTLGAKSALNVKLAEDILTPLGITTPYITDGGNLTLEFTIQAADVRGAAQVFSSNFAFGVYPLQTIPSTSSGGPTVLVANFMNGNDDAFNSRVYLWNPSQSAGEVAVRVFTLPLSGGLAQELTGSPLDLGTLGAKSALNVKLAEDILTPLGITTPYITDGGNLTLEFTIQAADVRGTAQVFSPSFAFGTYPLQWQQTCTITQITSLVARDSITPSITGDGSRIAFTSSADLTGENADGSREIFMMNAGGSGVVQLTNATLGRSESPFISRDGSRIVLTSSSDLTGENPDRNFEIFIISSDGTGLKQLTSSNGKDKTSPSISDDGSRVVFHSSANLTGQNPDGSQEIFFINADGTDLRQLTDSPQFGPTFSGVISGGGSKVAFASTADLTGENPNRNQELFVIDTDGTALRQLTHTDETLKNVVLFPSISGDGSKIAFISFTSDSANRPVGGGMFTISSDGSGLVTLPIPEVNRIVSFGIIVMSNDGAQVLFTGRFQVRGPRNRPAIVSQIHAVNTDGTNLRQVTNFTSSASAFPSQMSINSDASRITFASSANLIDTNSDRNQEIFLVIAAVGVVSQLTDVVSESQGSVRSPDISRDGSKIVFVSSADLLPGSNPEGNSEIFVVNSNGTELSQLTSATFGRSISPAMSGDGSKVVFVSTGDLTGSRSRDDIFLVNTDGTGLVQLTQSARASNPSISNDGRVVFESREDLTGQNPDNSQEIFSVGPIQLTDSDFFPDNFASSLSGDGSSIVFLDSRLTLFLMNADGTNLHQLTGDANLPSITDDGSRIAFYSDNNLAGLNPDKSHEVFVINSDGSGLQQVTSTLGNLFPGFPFPIGGPEISGDGSRIAFFSIEDLTGDNPDANLEIFLINADGTGLRQVTSHTSGEIQGTIGLFIGSVPDQKLSVSADGLSIAFASDADLSGDNSDGSAELFQATCSALP